MRVAMSKQSLWIVSLTYLEVYGFQSFLNKVSFDISIFAIFYGYCQQLEVMDVCCALIDVFDCFLEFERFDLLLDIVSDVFKSDASAFDD